MRIAMHVLPSDLSIRGGCIITKINDCSIVTHNKKYFGLDVSLVDALMPRIILVMLQDQR